MKLKQFVEEWTDTIKSEKEVYEIFKNPTKAEIRKLIMDDEDLRFFAHAPSKSIYVFAGNLLHCYASKKIKIAKDYMDNPDVIGGTVEFKGNKLVVSYVHDIELKITEKKIKEKLRRDWSFIDKYFSFKPLLDRYKNTN